ncbi:Protein of unknown function [Algoriphagus alkaliphilus]|uniref:DUF1573 domain-containing protein n=2 Tax=Algoriphagus alkaliphilus TaxID=279824 RepID=A0A1G5Z6G5_9BACT|nr:Protein of unknown function [Algoriphagus alkaliphilus]
MRRNYALIAVMIRFATAPLIILVLFFFPIWSYAQSTGGPKLIWKVNRLDLGTILEEQGLQKGIFEFSNTQDSLFYITDVLSECGCTTVEYTRDSLELGESGKLIISFDPTSAAVFFSKLIVVKGNLSGIKDSLYLEGISVPYPSDIKRAYPVVQGDLGFRLKKVNMGDVFDNEPKIKYVEFFNMGDQLLDKGAFRSQTPPHIQISQVQQFVRPQERGLLMIRYDGKIRNDLGYFEDQVPVSWENIPGSEVKLDLIADLFEFFPPIQKSNLNDVPQLFIGQKEIDLREISSKTLARRSVTLTNKGRQTLEIRKIQGNCECLKIEVPKSSLAPGESMELSLTLDPIGRKGIDQRNIYIFSNDPLNPVQLIVMKSRIE